MSDNDNETNKSLACLLSSTYEQCHDLSRKLNETLESNKSLNDENRRLRQELSDTRTELNKIVTEGQYGAQLQELFEKSVQRQMEVDSLREELRKYKRRYEKSPTQLSPVPTPSSKTSRGNTKVTEEPKPVKKSDVTTAVASKRSLSDNSSKQIAGHSMNRPSKRVYLQFCESHGIPPKRATPAQQVKQIIRMQAESKKKTAGVISAAEDGEDYEVEQPTGTKGKKATSIRDPSVLGRLDGLLSGPTPSRTKLSSDQFKRPESSIHRSKPPANTNNTALSRWSDSEQQSPPVVGSRKVFDIRAAFKTPINGKSTTQENVRHSGSADNHATTRSRPTSASFRSENFSGGLSNDEILLRFMGPGSEDRISKMTPLARSNLLHEARTVMLVSGPSKDKDSFVRAQSPPGFWDMDMPGTQ